LADFPGEFVGGVDLGIGEKQTAGKLDLGDGGSGGRENPDHPILPKQIDVTWLRFRAKNN